MINSEIYDILSNAFDPGKLVSDDGKCHNDEGSRKKITYYFSISSAGCLYVILIRNVLETRPWPDSRCSIRSHKSSLNLSANSSEDLFLRYPGIKG